MCAPAKMASRPIPSLEELFNPALRIRVRAEDGDVRRYIETRLEELPGRAKAIEGMATRIINDVTAAVNGM